MRIDRIYNNYFNGFRELSNFQENSWKKTAIAVAKVASYLTVVIPLFIAAAFYVTLSARIIKYVKQTPESKTVHEYPGDLKAAEKTEIQTQLSNDYRLKITLKDHPQFDISIRRENIFQSNAEVIVNAANSHLSGGGGIDGAIHREGGEDYEIAHCDLKWYYWSNYKLGHAVMTRSGDLKKKYNIKNVIVVAGPQGDTTRRKESQLYSCYYNSLCLAHSQNKTSIALPSISTGIYGFPKDRAAEISLKAVKDFAENHQDSELKTISIHFLPSEPKENLTLYRNAIL